MPLGKPRAVCQVKTFRKLKEVDISVIQKDIQESSLYTAPAEEIDDMVSQYNTVLQDIMDAHAPLQTKSVVVRDHKPWFSDEINTAKKARCRAERMWCSTKLTVHLDLYKSAHRKVVNMCTSAKSEFLCTCI